MHKALANDAVEVLGCGTANEAAVYLLLEHLGAFVPVVGAGLCVSYGYPTWRGLLWRVAKDAGLVEQIEGLLDEGSLEAAAQTLAERLQGQFDDVIEDLLAERRLPRQFDHGPLRYLPRVARDLVLTTNLDRSVEAVFAEAQRPFANIYRGLEIRDSLGAIHQGAHALLKLHGDIGFRSSRVLVRADYDAAYGSADANRLDLTRPIPAVLARILAARPLLFLGCSLVADRATQVIAHVARTHPETRHIALLPSSDDEPSRREQLRAWNVTPLFYRSGEFHRVEAFLNVLAQSQPAALASRFGSGASVWFEGGRPFQDLLDTHWADPLREEALARVVAERWGTEPVEANLCSFVEYWRARHAQEPSTLRDIGRSPLLVALGLVARATVKVERPLLGASTASDAVRLNLAVRDFLSPQAFAFLADDEDRTVRAGVAANPAAPPRELARLARQRNSELGDKVAANQAAPPDTLHFLSTLGDEDIRCAVAENPGSLPATHARLAKDEVESIREVVAYHSAAVTAQQIASHDTSISVRRALARNKALAPEVATLLAEDGAPWVRYDVARFTGVANLVATLAFDSATLVRAAAISNALVPYDVLLAAITDPENDVRAGAARNPHLPARIMEQFVRDSPEIRRELAGNRGVTSSITNSLARDRDSVTRARLAQNSVVQADVLAQLAGDEDTSVRRFVARHPNSPREALTVLGKDSDLRVRSAVALNPNSPPEILEELSASTDEEIYLAVASNPATPRGILARLANAPEINVVSQLFFGAQLFRLVSRVAMNPSILPEDLATPLHPSVGRRS